MHFMIAAMLVGCSVSRLEKKLEPDELGHWRALRVYMEEEEQKTYLKSKTRPERDDFLKQNGLWDRFYQYPPHVRELIEAGEVQPGWTVDMVLMSWGQPYSRDRVFGRDAQESERLTYRFEQQPDGAYLVWVPNSKTQYKAVRLFVFELITDDGKVMTMEEKDASW